MKARYLACVVALAAFVLVPAAVTRGQAPPPNVPSPPELPAEGTGLPDHVTTDFPSAYGTAFPPTTGSTGAPPTESQQGMDTTMPQSGIGTGTGSTFGGSGTGSGGLGRSTYGPYTESPMGAGR